MSAQAQHSPAKLPTGRNHVSYSEIAEWARCSWKHKLNHVEKLGSDAPSPHLIFGTAIHDACESIVKSRTYDPKALVETLIAGWTAHQELDAFKSWTLEDAVSDALEIVEDVLPFLDREFPNWRHVDAEARLYEPIAGADGVFFKGFIDCVIAVPTTKGETLWILDWKTSSRGWFRDKRSDQVIAAQVVLYRNFVSPRLGIDQYDAKCGFVILNRSAKPGTKCELFRVSAGEVTVTRALKMLTNAITSIKRGIAVKNKGEACKWCEHNKTSRCP